MFRSSQGSVFVLGALGTRPRFVGCVDVDTLTEPGGAIDTLIRCFDPDSGWKIRDYTLSAPDPVTTTFTMPLGGGNPDLLFDSEPFGLLITQRKGGRIDLDANYDRAWVICSAHAALSAGNVLQREEQTASELTVEITATPPVARVAAWDVLKRSVPTDDIAFVGDVGLTSLTNDDLYYTRNGGATWTRVSKPFDVVKVALIQTGRNAYRFLVARVVIAGSPATIAYSDNWGATWVTIAASGVNGQTPLALHALRPTSLWLATTGGYLYHSANSGQDWRAAHSGLYTTGDLNAAAFHDDNEGWAVGDGDKILFTRNAGSSWDLFSTGGGDDLTSVSLLGELVLVGTSSGKLFVGGEAGTFGQVATLPAAIVAAHFVSHCPHVMAAVTATTAYISVNCGWSWRAIATGTYTGMTFLREPLRLWLTGGALTALGSGLINQLNLTTLVQFFENFELSDGVTVEAWDIGDGRILETRTQ